MVPEFVRSSANLVFKVLYPQYVLKPKTEEKQNTTNMSEFPRLHELAKATGSHDLFDSIALYFQRENYRDLKLANGLLKCYVDLVHVTKETQEFMSEVNGRRTSLMSWRLLQDLKKIQMKNVIKAKEINKMISETHAQVLDRNNFIEFLRKT